MKKSRKDLVIGIVLGLVVPAVAYLFLLLLYDSLGEAGVVSSSGLSPNFRKRTVTLIAICANLIPFSIFNKRRSFSSMRGVVISTIIYGLIWVYYFGAEILSE